MDRISHTVRYEAPLVLWIEAFVPERDFLQGSELSGSVSAGGMGHTGLQGYEDDDWGGHE